MFDLPDDTRHRDGIAWFDAPMPPRKHECFAQTSGWIGLDQVLRCACGAIRNTRFDRWIDKNSRGANPRLTKKRKPLRFGWIVASYIAGWVLFVAGMFTTDIPTLLMVEIPALLLLSAPAVVEFTPALRERF